MSFLSLYKLPPIYLFLIIVIFFECYYICKHPRPDNKIKENIAHSKIINKNNNLKVIQTHDVPVKSD